MIQDKQYWMRLSERYFEAETTDEEERQLRQFAATTDDADFTELRAVMGLSAMARHMVKAQPDRSRVITMKRYVGIAASMLVILGAALYFSLHQAQEPDCIAYVNGKEVTDPDIVMKLMQNSMQEFSTEISAIDPIEAQMSEMFDLL